MEQIATLSLSLTQKPYVKTKENLDQLYTLCKSKDLDISKNAIKSVMLVLIDILPSYSVGKHSKNENLSKEVRERRAHDKILLDFTRRFNQFCEAAAFNRTNAKKIRCAAALALSKLVKPQDLEQASLLPPLAQIREYATPVAVAVAQYLYEQELATVPIPAGMNLEQFIKSQQFNPSATYEPVY